MNIKARAVAAANYGLITRAQALDAGMCPATIGLDLRTGDLVGVSHGVYALGEVWAELDEFRGRHRLRTRAAISKMRRNWVASHDSAAHEHGLPVLNPPNPFVHITRAGFTGAWTKNGVKHHLARFSEDQVVEIEGLKVLDLPRTAVDIARELGAPYGEIACDAVLRRGYPRSALETAVAVMEHWPNVVRTRAAVAFADPGAESPLETMGRMLAAQLGIEDMETQFPAQLLNGRVVWGDIRVGRHFFECDGKRKYVAREDGGLADRRQVEVLWDEKKRERDLHQVGLGTSRILFEDYWQPRRTVLARMRSEYDDTVRLFGSSLPDHLRVNARRLRGLHGA